LLKYKKGDKVVCSVKTPEDIENVESLYDLLLRGNLPDTIPYNKLQDIVSENMRLNGNKYNITLQLLGILLGQLYRDPKNIDRPYRLTDDKTYLDYKAIDVRQVPKHTSPFVSITSENWDESVVGAITTKNDKYSPMEKLLMD
jgi:hypothetical protein